MFYNNGAMTLPEGQRWREEPENLFILSPGPRVLLGRQEASRRPVELVLASCWKSQRDGSENIGESEPRQPDSRPGVRADILP